MKTRLLFLLSPLLFLSGLHAQDFRLKWLQNSYDFGTFKEAAGPRTGQVQFVNLGPDTTMITRVRPSCGCTGAEFTRDPIPPGDTATVWFTYNPANRPGRFEKTVKVYVGEQQQLKVIHIKGTIIGAPSSLRASYPVEAGPLRLSDTLIDFGTFAYNEARHKFLRAYNQGTLPLRPHVEGAPGAVDIKFSADTVLPGDIFTISLYFNSRKDPQLGAAEYPMTIYADSGDGAPALSLTARAEVLPPIAQLTSEEQEKAGRLDLPEPVVEVKTSSHASKVKFSFPVVNSGKSELRIMRVYSRADAVKITRIPSRLAPGKKAEVHGEIDLAKVDGVAFGFIVEVISSDPATPVRTLRLCGQNPK